MRRFVSRRVLTLFPLHRTLTFSESTLPVLVQSDKFTVNCRQLRLEDAYWRSRQDFNSKAFSTEAEKKGETANSEQETPVDEVEAVVSEVPSVEELTIDSLSQSNKELEATMKKQEEILAQLSNQLEDEKKKRLQALAEAENLRTRFARESVQTKKFAVQEFMKSLLGCIDNLDRAVESVPENLRNSIEENKLSQEQLLRAMEVLLTGVKLTQSEFKSVLIAQGVTRYDPIDEVFDPNRHMARFELDDPSKEPGTIGIVTLCGYKMHDRIIRPAEVGVVKKRQESTSSKMEEETEAGQ
eukprot:g2970.t1